MFPESQDLDTDGYPVQDNTHSNILLDFLRSIYALAGVII